MDHVTIEDSLAGLQSIKKRERQTTSSTADLFTSMSDTLQPLVCLVDELPQTQTRGKCSRYFLAAHRKLDQVLRLCPLVEWIGHCSH